LVKSNNQIRKGIERVGISDQGLEHRPLKNDGTHNKVYSTRKGIGASPRGSKGLAIVVLAVESINFGSWLFKTYDEKLINEHHALMIDKVLPAVVKALNSKDSYGNSYVPEHLRDDYSIALITNVVLSGKPNSGNVYSYTDEIVQIGLKIYEELAEKVHVKDNKIVYPETDEEWHKGLGDGN